MAIKVDPKFATRQRNRRRVIIDQLMTRTIGAGDAMSTMLTRLSGKLGGVSDWCMKVSAAENDDTHVFNLPDEVKQSHMEEAADLEAFAGFLDGANEALVSLLADLRQAQQNWRNGQPLAPEPQPDPEP